jgi:hypothetical protein
VDDDSFETEGSVRHGVWWKKVLPFLALIVVVGVISALVLAGLVGTGGRHDHPAAPTTTTPTVQIQL